MKVSLKDTDVIGDTHGSFYELSAWAKHGRSHSLIHVGDIGVGFYGMYDKCKQFGWLLQDVGKTAFFIRGNHDDPTYFDGRVIGGLQLVPDYSRINTEDGSILCVGGAISLDRSVRQRGTTYWHNEGFVLDPSMVMDDPITHVITHTACLKWTGLPRRSHFVDSWCAVDAALRDNLDKESDDMEALHRTIVERGSRPVRWFYGHFHQSHLFTHHGTQFIGLAEHEVKSL